MAYKISTTHQFEKDLKRCIKHGYPMDEFRTVIQLLERDGRLPKSKDRCQRIAWIDVVLGDVVPKYIIR